jgi:hypothetical protein
MPFHCENPDFLVHSVPDDITFPVNRNAMQRSEIFRTPFANVPHRFLMVV